MPCQVKCASSGRSTWKLKDNVPITASIDNGVLSLIVPKPEQMKPKSITIGVTDDVRQLGDIAG